MSPFYSGLLVGSFIGTFAGIFIAALCVAAGWGDGVSYQDNSEFGALLIERGDEDD